MSEYENTEGLIRDLYALSKRVRSKVSQDTIADAIQDVTNKDKPIMVEVEYSSEVGRENMVQMLKAWAERKEE